MKNKIHLFAIIELTLISIFTIGFLIYIVNDFDLTIMSISMILIFVCMLIILFVNFLCNKLYRTWIGNAIIIVTLLIINFGFLQVNLIAFNYSNAMSRMNQGTVYRTVLIADKDNGYKGVSSITSTTKIGVQSPAYFENGQLAREEIEKLDVTENIVEFPNIKSAFEALKNGEIDMMSSNGLNDDFLKELDPNIENDFNEVVVFEREEQLERADIDITQKPFTILISGSNARNANSIDVQGNNNANILITFNPQTGRMTTLTTPRDSFIQLQCGNYSVDKLSHAEGTGGFQCVKDTLEKLYDIKIDYTVSINFNGLIGVVDALGGIDVDVPINQINSNNPEVCEQDSLSRRGANSKCWIEGKVNHMDGETALAFTRNRKNQDGGDFSRGRNQQIVIMAILQKVTQINNVDTINKLLTTVSHNVSTNITTSEIISLYEIFLNIGTNIDIEQLGIGGTTGMVGNMSVVYPNQEDLRYAAHRMKVNLNINEPIFPTSGFGVNGRNSQKLPEFGQNPVGGLLMPFNY